MGFDARLKRFFPLVILALLGIVAYLQADGIGQLVASTIGAAPSSAGQRSFDRGTKRPGLDRSRRSGREILARNPFDSQTGPLDGRALTIPDGGVPLETPESDGDPYADPTCDFGRVVLISTAEDPEWSFAAIESTSGEAMLRRTGDEVAGHKVHFVSWDRVWLTGTSGRCQLKLGDKSAKKSEPAPRRTSRSRRSRRRGRQLPPEMASKIHKVSDTEFNVERSVVDEILENQAQLMRSARIVPEKDGDKVVGIRMFGIRNGTLLDHLGFQNGDRLSSINDFEITDPQKALEAYGRLRTADHLKVSVVRKGSPMTIDFNIQ